MSKEKDKSIFYTTHYLGSILTVIGMPIFVTIMILQIVKQEDSHNRIEGEIMHSHIRWGVTPFDVRLNTNRGEIWFQSYVKEDFPILQEKVIDGKNAIIWYERVRASRHNRNQTGLIIRKMIVDDEIVIPFSRHVGMRIIFICLAIFFFVISLLYVLKNPAHLVGRKE